MSGDDGTLALPEPRVPGWDHEADVVIVGHGGTGASAAIEAARAGADTLVLERLTRGGGTTASSTGVVYCGGGTRVQRACGFDDSVDEMIKHVRLAGSRQVDEEKVRLYCERSVEHFDWMCGLGVPFTDAFVAEKTTHPFGEESLFYSGNELVYPFVDEAVPAPRGHKPARTGEVGGFLAEFLLRGSHDAGARVLNECRAQRLVQNADRRVVGVVAHLDGRTVYVRARDGVILAAGGFIMNKAMVAEYAPDLLAGNWDTGTVTDDGLGIRIGAGAGGALVNMHEGLVINAIYPPGSHCKGILVNGQGQRFVNEDAYAGRFSDAMLARAEGRAFLVLDDEIHGETQAFHQVAAGLPLEGRTYASGLSIGDATFFGRVAGRHAAGVPI